MVDPFQDFLDKKTSPFVKYLRKKDVLERVDQQLTPAIKSYVKSYVKGQAQVTYPNIPELIAQELKKLPPRVIEKVLEKETIVKEIAKEDKKKYAEKETLEILQKKFDELQDLMEKFKQSVSLGGSGVVGLPQMNGQSGKFLTTNGAKPSWADAGASIGGSISGGTPYHILFIDANGNIAQDDFLEYDGLSETVSFSQGTDVLKAPIFVKNTSTTVTNAISSLGFILNNSLLNPAQYGFIGVKAIDPTYTSLEAAFEIWLRKSGTTTKAAAFSSDGTLTLGDGSTNGCWRFRISGTDLLHERLESSLWVEKGRDIA